MSKVKWDRIAAYAVVIAVGLAGCWFVCWMIENALRWLGAGR